MRVCGSYEKTVRSVANGILAIALIQSILTGLAFMLAGVPLANLWALLCLILSIAQIKVAPIVIPIIIYLFHSGQSSTAVALLAFYVPCINRPQSTAYPSRSRCKNPYGYYFHWRL